MSFAMDEFGLAISLDPSSKITYVDRIEQKSSTKQEEAIDQPEKTESINLSGNALNKNLSKHLELEEQQGEFNVLETASDALKDVEQGLDEIKKLARNAIDNSDFSQLTDNIQKELAKIEETVNQATFNGSKVLNGFEQGFKSSQNNVKINNEADQQELRLDESYDVNAVIDQVAKAKESINQQQIVIEDKKAQIETRVSHLIAIDAAPNSVELELASSEIGNKLQDEVKQELGMNVEKAQEIKKAHITNFNGNMIIALLSLRAQ